VTTVLQATSALHVRWAFRSEAVLDELRGHHILVQGQYYCHGKVLRHGSQKCRSDMVFLSSTGDNYVVAEAEGYASHQLPGLSDKASHCPSSVPVHTGPRGVPTSVRLKVLSTESSSAYSAQFDCH
jgi:hypothetical protein